MSKRYLAGGAAAALMAGALNAQAAPVATGDGLPIAVQMYTMRDFGTLDEQLAAVERAGVKAIETVGTQGVTSDELNALLDTYDLDVISTHADINSLRTDLDSVIEFNRAVGNDTITMPYLGDDQRPDDAAGWQALGTELGGISDRLEAEDMRLAYHNHDFEMVTFGGDTALEILLDAAGPDVLSQLDVAWVARGGFDPAEFLGRLDGRLHSIHAKDNAPEGTAPEERGFAAVGEGVLDWETILPAAAEAGAEQYIIEHDMPLDAEEVITIGNRFLTERLPDVLAPTEQPAPIPVPAALPLMAAGLGALGLVRRRRRA